VPLCRLLLLFIATSSCVTELQSIAGDYVTSNVRLAYIYLFIYLWCSWESMCLKHALVTVHCTSSQVNNCRTVSTTGSFGKHWCTETLANCLPGHCDRVAATRGVAERYCFHTQVPCLLGKYKRIVGTRQVSTCVTFSDSRW